MFLRFGVTVPKEKRNPNLAKEIIAEELSGILNWAITEGSGLVINKRFSPCAKIDTMQTQFETESSSVAMFIHENEYFASKEDYVTSKVLYSQYGEYCKESGFKPVNSTEFLRRLGEQLNFTVRRKATNNATWIYCKKKNTSNAVNISNENPFNIFMK